MINLLVLIRSTSFLRAGASKFDPPLITACHRFSAARDSDARTVIVRRYRVW